MDGRAGFVIVMAQLRDVLIRSGRLICPDCGSDRLIYCEDVTMRTAIAELKDDVLWVEEDAVGDDLAFNERVRCEECGAESELPEWMAVERKEF